MPRKQPPPRPDHEKGPVHLQWFGLAVRLLDDEVARRNETSQAVFPPFTWDRSNTSEDIVRRTLGAPPESGS